jgi:hypothetical protein
MGFYILLSAVVAPLVCLEIMVLVKRSEMSMRLERRSDQNKPAHYTADEIRGIGFHEYIRVRSGLLEAAKAIVACGDCRYVDPLGSICVLAGECLRPCSAGLFELKDE